MPSSRYLSWYVRHFNTVEINNCFYRLPTESAVAAWRNETPRDFCFAVKASRFITHVKRLRDPRPALETYLSRMEALQSKLGPVLFQLPPNWRVNTERLSEFLSTLPAKRHLYVCEFRDPTWYTPAVYDLLRKYNVALCVHDWRGQRSPIELTADHAYIRLHGATGKYQGNYTNVMLSSWADHIREWMPRLRAIYVYFNNDQGGHAVRNALTLQSWLNVESEKRCA
jgi:uncharacterized protein YecE (DUF72 family)